MLWGKDAAVVEPHEGIINYDWIMSVKANFQTFPNFAGKISFFRLFFTVPKISRNACVTTYSILTYRKSQQKGPREKLEITLTHPVLLDCVAIPASSILLFQT